MNQTLRWILILGIAYLAWSRLSQTINPVGRQLPPMEVEYASGAEPYTIGLPAIVEFWATWCPPCRESIAHLNELKASGADIGLQVIGITDEDEETVNRFRRGTRMDYTVAYDAEGRLAKHFLVRGIPYAVLVDRLGKIRWAGHPGELTDFKIREALR